MDVNNPLKMVLIGIDPYPYKYIIKFDNAPDAQFYRPIDTKDCTPRQISGDALRLCWSAASCTAKAREAKWGFQTPNRRGREAQLRLVATEKKSGMRLKCWWYSINFHYILWDGQLVFGRCWISIWSWEYVGIPMDHHLARAWGLQDMWCVLTFHPYKNLRAVALRES